MKLTKQKENKERREKEFVRKVKGSIWAKGNVFTLPQLTRLIFGGERLFLVAGQAAVFRLLTRPSSTGLSTEVNYELAVEDEGLQTVKEAEDASR